MNVIILFDRVDEVARRDFIKRTAGVVTSEGEMVRTLGLIGGMSWESTALYYRHLNELAREHLGGLHSAKSSYGRSTLLKSPSISTRATGRVRRHS